MKIKMLLATMGAALVCLTAQAQEYNYYTISQSGQTVNYTEFKIDITNQDRNTYNVTGFISTTGTDWTSIKYTFWDGTVKTFYPGRNDQGFTIATRPGFTNKIKIEMTGNPKTQGNGGAVTIMSVTGPTTVMPNTQGLNGAWTLWY